MPGKKEAVRAMYYGEEEYVPLLSKKKFDRKVEKLRKEDHRDLLQETDEEYWD